MIHENPQTYRSLLVGHLFLWRDSQVMSPKALETRFRVMVMFIPSPRGVLGNFIS